MTASFANRFAAVALIAPIASMAATLTTHVVDTAGVAIGEAVIYVTPVNGKATMHGSRTAVIDQINRMFVPEVSVIEAGTAVTFPNKDNIRHQVYSFSPAKAFVLKLYSGVPAEPVVFDKPGLVVMGCNIHDQMVAYVQVVDTPWFGKTLADGTSRIELPAGDYDVHVWHFRETGDEVVRRVVIQNEQAVTVSLNLKPPGMNEMQP